MAVLGLRFCVRAFSSCGKWGPLFIAVRGPLTIVASPVAEHRPDAQAQQLWLMGLVALRHVGSSQTRARTRVPCIGRQTLNHCATREALKFFTNKFLEKLGYTVTISTSLWHTHPLAPLFLQAVWCDSYPHHLKKRTLSMVIADLHVAWSNGLFQFSSSSTSLLHCSLPSFLSFFQTTKWFVKNSTLFIPSPLALVSGILA